MRTRMIAKTGKKIITIMLSLMMVAGVFGGTKLDVKAASTIRFEDLQVGTIVHTGDTITISAVSNGGNKLSLACNKPDGGETDYPLGYVDNTDGSALSVKVGFVTHNGKTYTAFKLHHKVDETHFAFFEFTVENETDNDVAIGNTSMKNEHVCNFEWVTTIDPTTGADGLEEYKCAGCGVVKESHPIPASVAAVKDFFGNIKEAPENGSITYDSGKLYTISDYLLKKMSERSDVTVTVNFEYQNAKYELTFPAGTDFTPVLTDEDTMYGYFGVAAKLGLNVIVK